MLSCALWLDIGDCLIRSSRKIRVLVFIFIYVVIIAKSGVDVCKLLTVKIVNRHPCLKICRKGLKKLRLNFLGECLFRGKEEKRPGYIMMYISRGQQFVNLFLLIPPRRQQFVDLFLLIPPRGQQFVNVFLLVPSS